MFSITAKTSKLVSCRKHILKKKYITDYTGSNEYKNLVEAFPDIELIDIEKKDD